MIDKLRIGKKVICNNIVYCNNIFSKGFGLMFRTEKSVDDTAWIFPFRNPRKISLTMLFVFFPIDAIFLDGDKRILEMTSLKPWSFYNPRKEANYCLELKYGSIIKKRLKIGDKLDF